MKVIEVVAAVIQDGNNVLATQRGYGDYAGFWEFPGGKIEVEEQHEQALTREIQEEMAADIIIDRFICTVEQQYPDFKIVMHCYLCTLASTFELLEHSKAKWVDSSSIRSLEWLPADIKVIDQLASQKILR